MGFLLSPSLWRPRALQAIFDITGDLDTPVSAFMKLAAFRPRFLLESVEGGERLGRFSFIGFGDGLEVRLDAHGLVVGEERLPVPPSTAALLAQLRSALPRAPRPQPGIGRRWRPRGVVGVVAPHVAWRL